jgi:hypothetical protein
MGSQYANTPAINLGQTKQGTVFTRRPNGFQRLCFFAGVLIATFSCSIPSASTSTVAFWRFEEGPAGSVATGAIFGFFWNGLNGTPFGGPACVLDSGSVPGSTLGLNFNGTSSRIFVPDSSLLQLTHSLTLDAYIEINGPISSCCGLAQIIFRGDDRPGLDPYYLAVTTSGQLVFSVENASGQQAELVPLALFRPAFLSAVPARWTTPQGRNGYL